MEQAWKLFRIISPIVVPVVFLLVVTLWSKWRVYRNSKNPETKVTAEVVDRWTQGFVVGPRYHRRKEYAYYIRFRPVDGGESREFQVGEAEYNDYHLRDRGPLTYRTWEFISFRPESRGEVVLDVPVAFADDDTEDQ